MYTPCYTNTMSIIHLNICKYAKKKNMPRSHEKKQSVEKGYKVTQMFE